MTVTDLNAMLLTGFAYGSDDLKQTYVQTDAEVMTAVDLEFGMTDAGLD